jgi:UPF0755 protein
MTSVVKGKVFHFLGGIIACFLAAVVIIFGALHKKSRHSFQNKSIIIEKAKTSDELAQLLVNEGIADNLFVARCAVAILGVIPRYNARVGEYLIPTGCSIYKAVKIFASGQSILHRITIPEGFSVFQTIAKLEKNEFLRGNITDIPEEGSLLPNTYLFRYPTERQQIITHAQKAMAKLMREVWPSRSPNCLLKNPRDALILASIVEKETCRERELVAGIFLNRLAKKMKLQSDITTIYAITRGKPFGRKLRYSDLKVMDPFNTYRFSGLPPTPITNPGRKSIIAVLHPAITDHLFFLTDGPNIFFSKTFEGHKQNIAKVKVAKANWQKNIDSEKSNQQKINGNLLEIIPVSF